MMYAVILALVYNGISVSTTNVASLLTANNSENKTIAVSQNSLQPSIQQEMNNLKQQLNQEALIRLSLTKQLYSVLNDVIKMKKGMGQMESKIRELEIFKNSTLGDDVVAKQLVNLQKDLVNLTSTCTTASQGKEAIAFNAVISKTLLYDRDTPVNIVYDTVLYDTHGAYSSQSGVFTAPHKGLYIFTWTTLVAAGKILDTELIVNGTRKGLGNCNNEGNPGFENCANTVPVVLEAGDTVNVRSVTGNFVHGHEWSSFKGWRN